MKKILQILLLLIVTCSSCKKTDEKKENLLLGKWYAKKIVLLEPVEQTIVPTAADGWIEFKENGEFIEADSPTRTKYWTYNAVDLYLMVNDIKIMVNKLTKDELYLLHTEINTNTGAKSKFEIQYGR
ncbi:hypothetical protein [Mucilaginibacter auburnensis]|uniref:Lipocalin-like protein n=1 Tax=Mucilaginibacter auburnensis TaxID=1457233 RepID=A0A2H9VP69_9SPHI|nr:hypothetical protein [Mucilaginibacter auburnensis]PJJ80103.1 hypothetical protein CLV57_3247 [Mucilaginibacter auburnensis]